MMRTGWLLLLALTTTAHADAKGWWTTKSEQRSGKTIGGVKFTIDLPTAVEQMPPPTSSQFVARDGETAIVLMVQTMVEFAQHTKSYAEFKEEHIPKDAVIFQEESSKTRFAVLFKEDPKGTTVIGTVANQVGEMQSMCTWTIPEALLKDKTVSGWGVMKKACFAIKLTPKK